MSFTTKDRLYRAYAALIDGSSVTIRPLDLLQENITIGDVLAQFKIYRGWYHIDQKVYADRIGGTGVYRLRLSRPAS